MFSLFQILEEWWYRKFSPCSINNAGSYRLLKTGLYWIENVIIFLIFWDSLYGIGIVANSPVNSGNVTDRGSSPGSGRSLGGGHSSPLQFSCLGIPTDRGAWPATIHMVVKSQTRLKRLSTHAHSFVSYLNVW